MPSGVYERTEEHKRNIGKSVRKLREIRICVATGCDATFECIVTSRRKYCSPGGCCRRGKPGWSAGLTKKTHPGLASASEKKSGKIQSKESNEKRSRKLKGRSYIELFGEEGAKELIKIRSESIKGENNSNWKGGVSENPYPEEFVRVRKKIKARDGYQCQLCGRIEIVEKKKLGRGLPVHHIDYDKQNCRSENLITLCCSCNAKVNTNREYWEKYFKDTMERVVYS